MNIPGVIAYPLNGAVIGALSFGGLSKWLGHIFQAYPEVQSAALAGASSFAGIQFLVKGTLITIKKIPVIKELYAKHCSYEEHKWMNITLKGVITASYSTAALYTIPQLKILRETRVQAIAFVAGSVFTALQGQQVIKFLKSPTA